jgi:hypothetical protein
LPQGGRGIAFPFSLHRRARLPIPEAPVPAQYKEAQTAVADAETAVSIQHSRLVASAALIQALGGGWDVPQLPGREQIKESAPLNFSPFPPPVQAQSR